MRHRRAGRWERSWGRIRAARRQRGAALLVAIAAVGLIAAISVELIEGVQDEILMAEAYRDDFRARWAVQAPVAVVIGVLQTDANEFTGLTESWATLNEKMNINGVEVSFRVRDESSKINPNGLGAEDPAVRDRTADLLTRFFEGKILDGKLVDHLSDWIDEDTEARGSGAEGNYYKTLRPPYAVKNARLQTLSELPLVQGFTEKVLKELGFPERGGTQDLDVSEWLTLFSDGAINLNTVDPLILRNLPVPLPAVFINEILARRKVEPFKSLEEVRDLTGMTDELFSLLSPLVTVDSEYFSIRAEAVAGRILKHLTAVVKKTENQVSIVYWRIS